MKSKYYLGIDHGADGGFALIRDDGELMLKKPMPKHPVDGGIDHYEVEGIMAKCKHIAKDCDIIVGAEKLHAIFGSSAKSNFNFGSNIGYVLGLVHVWFGRGVNHIPARTWQSWLFKKENIDEVKNSKNRRDTKAMATKAVTQIYPNEDFRKTKRSKIPHSGIVDAVGIGLYMMGNNFGS